MRKSNPGSLPVNDAGAVMWLGGGNVGVGVGVRLKRIARLRPSTSH